jgi:hypothetical protein
MLGKWMMGDRRVLFVLAGFLIITFFMTGAPVAAVVVTIDDTQSIQTAIDNLVASPDPADTLILNPGTYAEYDIVIKKNILIRANTSYGHDAADTVIDAMKFGRIFDNAAGHTLTVDSLALRNTSYNRFYDGGAIVVGTGGSLTVTSSAFTNCSVLDYGGAISVTGGTLTVTSTTFTDCHSSMGGAVYAGASTVLITASTFTRCSGTEGGAIANSGTLTVTSSEFISCTVTQNVDGEAQGGAISNSGTLTVTFSTFTGCSAQNALYVSAGGAIHNRGGAATIASSAFNNCYSGAGSYDLGGGAISNDFGGTLSVTSSAFNGCSATTGGAIYNEAATLTLTGATFTGCSATTYGGAIDNVFGGALTITAASVFSGCTATNGGAIYASGTTGITDTTFSGCTADYGGAISLSGGSASIGRSAFTGCSATDAGAVYNYNGALSVASSSFSTCTSDNDGGAIYNTGASGTADITNATFTGCTASRYGGAINSAGAPGFAVASSSFTGSTATTGGGAIAVSGSGAPSILSSDFESCSGGSDGGGAVLSFPATTIHFSRFHGNSASGSGTAVRFVSSSSTATNNWWSSNSGPGAAYSGNPAAVASWLVLGIAANPSPVSPAGASAIRADLTCDSDHNCHAPGSGHVPDGIPGSWAIITGSGAISPATGTMLEGANITTFSPAGTGMTNISATVDSQTMYIEVPVIMPTPAPTPVVTLDTSGNDDGFPSPAVSPTATQAGTLPPMTVTVNIGGDSKAWQAVVTGTKLSDLIVTGTVQHGPADNQTAPPGTVFQYISLTPARYNTITGAVISFSIPQAWLDANHIDPKSIVLYHLTTNGWEALPTMVLYTKDGTVYYSAQTASFSLFAIAGTPATATTATIATTQGVMSAVVQTPAPAAAIVKAPVTTQTTVPPATTAKPSAPSPLLNLVLVIAAIGMLAGGGFIVRRWWVRQQNPALFEES